MQSQSQHDQIVLAANILDLLKNAQIDMPTLEAFSLACDLEIEAVANELSDALEALELERSLWEDGESEYSEYLLDSVRELLNDSETYSFIKLYCEERFNNN